METFACLNVNFAREILAIKGTDYAYVAHLDVGGEGPLYFMTDEEHDAAYYLPETHRLVVHDTPRKWEGQSNRVLVKLI